MIPFLTLAAAQSAAPVTAVTGGQIGWVSALVFGFPLAMLLLGEAIRRMRRRRLTYAPAVGTLRSLVLPSLALLVLLAKVMGLPRTGTPVRLAETLVWISLIYAALTLLKGILFEDAPADSWQAKVPRLVSNLGSSLLVLVGSSIVLSSVWGADLGGFLTALGVGSLVLGLALQDSLGNIFSGVALLAEQPIALGDWIEIGDNQGRVVEVNWRAVHLLTPADVLLVVPNSELGKTSFMNFSRPTPSYLETVTIGFSYDDPPNRVRELLRHTALEVEGVEMDPPPEVSVLGYGDFAITYEVEIRCKDRDQGQLIRKDFLARLWYMARRNRLTIPYPIQSQVAYAPSVPSHAQALLEKLQVLRESSCFAVLPAALLKDIAEGGEERDYAAGEVVIDRGMPLFGLYLILEGAAELEVVDARGKTHVLGVLTKGEVFGERSSLLHDRVSDSTVRALEDLRVLVIEAETLQQAVDRHPRLAHDLGQVMEIRRRALDSQGLPNHEPSG
jgi:small-conductance mechanosensitive channel